MESNAVQASPWMTLPFGTLLAMIALGPLLVPAWWARHYAKVAFTLAAITLAYYFVGIRSPGRVWETAHEYVGFIALIGSLYVVSGGIHIDVGGEAKPVTNVFFLLIGAVIANVFGTTGASMLLIRPWLRMNKRRISAYHVIFFIFIVSNVGGCLTPIGDPPLFLGYLMGVPFWWVAEFCWPMWVVGVGLLLVMFWWVDARNHRRIPKRFDQASTDSANQLRLSGLGNLFFLGIILAAVFIHRPPFVREGLMTAAALGSYFTTRKAVHESNQFNFHPLQEVAILFIGIFATMMPALDWLQSNAGRMDHVTASFAYWGCGGLSSALDNAPTYFCFLKALFGRFVDPEVVSQVHNLAQMPVPDLASVSGIHAEEIKQTYFALQKFHAADLAAGKVGTDDIRVACLLGNPALNGFLVAISVSSVFFGACTYIGNGPNFMVKSIADHQQLSTPSFLGYLFKFTLPFMLPMLLIVWWLFFRQ